MSRDTLRDVDPAVTAAAIDDTADDLRPPVAYPLGSDDHEAVEARRRQDEAYFDAPAGDPRAPRSVDLEGRVTALERGAARKSRFRTWAERIVSASAGTALAVLVWALTEADANGDARATAREREAERLYVLDRVRAHDAAIAAVTARLDGALDLLRLYFPAGALRLQGPARDLNQDPPP